ncbi:MAG: mechanosensitive ion channel family protein [Gammaproteobacteria bacterium]|nr:mechanosensitive ion channel family protein [Gammaproteobacteria bacterium]
MQAFFESQATITLLAIFVSFLLKLGAVKFLRKRAEREGKDNRYQINAVKNLINVVVVVVLFSIWANELQQFALSIAAFVMAIVLATKEIIQCVIGFIYLSSSSPFRVGDWIKNGDFVGEVTETDWAKVTLMEVDTESYSYTGKSIFLPNSQLMVQPITNLNYMKRYVNHSFSIVREDSGCNPYAIRKVLINEAKQLCDNFNDVAERYNSLIEKRLSVKISGPEPSIKISTTDIGKIRFSFSLFCPTQQAKNIEQKLTQLLFTHWAELQQSTSVKPDTSKEESLKIETKTTTADSTNSTTEKVKS